VTPNLAAAQLEAIWRKRETGCPGCIKLSKRPLLSELDDLFESS
jgi:hypothetical protein